VNICARVWAATTTTDCKNDFEFLCCLTTIYTVA